MKSKRMMMIRKGKYIIRKESKQEWFSCHRIYKVDGVYHRCSPMQGWFTKRKRWCTDSTEWKWWAKSERKHDDKTEGSSGDEMIPRPNKKDLGEE